VQNRRNVQVGSRDNQQKVVLINTIGLTELVSDALGSRKQKEVETNAKIVDLLKQARTWRDEELPDGTRYSDGDSSLVVELWLHRVDDDLSGPTFQEWDPLVGTDDTSTPVATLVNSSELRTVDFPLMEVDLYISTRWFAEAVVHATWQWKRLRVSVTVRLYSPWKTTMTSGQDVNEYLDTLGLVKSYFFKFFGKENWKKIEKKND
jgi:hypothetical protein